MFMIMIMIEWPLLIMISAMIESDSQALNDYRGNDLNNDCRWISMID
jgi:hypothetical protein